MLRLKTIDTKSFNEKDTHHLYRQLKSSRDCSSQQYFRNLPLLSERSANQKSSVDAVEEILTLSKKVESLELTIQIQQKEIVKLRQMNQYLVLSNQQKLELIHEERKMMFKHKAQSPVPSLNKQASPATKNQVLNLISKKKDEKRTSIVKQDKAEKLESILKKEGTQSIRCQTYRKQTYARNSQFNLNVQDDEHPVSKEFSRSDSSKLDKDSNFFSFLVVEECFKISAIMNIQLKDSDAIDLYDNDGTLILMQQLLQNEEAFLELVSHANLQKISFLYDKINRITQEHKQLFMLVLRMKKIIQGAIQMSQSILLDDALNTIVDEILQCLECDRASCFVVDHSKNEIWSKVAKGTQITIRFPIGIGIAGYVAQSKELLNIQNAYLDDRFNQETDVRTNYKTKTLLVCPILDGDRCLGVLQCVNKLDGHFSKEDEALLMILAEFSKVVLNNAINHDEQQLIHNKLRHTIKTGLILGSKVDNIKNLMNTSQQRLKALMNVEYAKVAFLSEDKKGIMHCLEDGSVELLPPDMGIIGEVIKENKMINTFNCYSHMMFNPAIDIKTQMPVIVMPIRSPFNENDVVGAISVVNVKGFATMFQNSQPKISPIDQEVLEFFTKQIAQFVIVNYQIESQQNSQFNTIQFDDPEIKDRLIE